MTAEAILTAETDPRDLDLLMVHAGALATRPGLPDATVEALLHRLTAYYEPRGEPVLAAPFRRQLVERHPDAPDGLAAAAQTHHAAHAHEAAIRYADRALDLTNDPGLRRDCRLVTAEALDSLGRISEADPIWRELETGADEPPDDPAGRLATRVALIRSRRIRGQNAQAEEQAKTSSPRSPTRRATRCSTRWRRRGWNSPASNS